MSSITVPHSLMLERILAMEIVRVTERAAVNAARLRGRGKKRLPTKPPSTPCGANSISCRSTGQS